MARIHLIVAAVLLSLSCGEEVLMQGDASSEGELSARRDGGFRDGGAADGGAAGDAGMAVDGGAVVDAGVGGVCVTFPGPADLAFKGNPGARALRNGELYVVYSGMKDLTNASYYNSSNIFVLRGTVRADGKREVVVFGAGYGDPNGTVLAIRKTKDAMRSGRADAADVDAVIRCGLGLTPETSVVRFITPHWHIDHTNQAFLSALVDLGHASLTIEVHALDAADAYSGQAAPNVPTVPAWTSPITARSVIVGSSSDGCGASPFSFESAAFGAWRAVVTPGHTNGTLSLENQTLGIRLDGADTTSCEAGAGIRRLPIHGDVGAL